MRHSYYILIKINCNKGLDSQNVYPATFIYLPIPSQECVSLCICVRCINFTYIYDLILDFLQCGIFSFFLLLLLWYTIHPLLVTGGVILIKYRLTWQNLFCRQKSIGFYRKRLQVLLVVGGQDWMTRRMRDIGRIIHLMINHHQQILCKSIVQW